MMTSIDHVLQTPKKTEIILGHPCSKDFSLNSLVICLEETFPFHSLQVFTPEGIATHTHKNADLELRMRISAVVTSMAQSETSV